MHAGIRFYRDGSVFVHAVRRIETMLMPELERVPGVRQVLFLRFAGAPGGADGGLGFLACDTAEQLQAVNARAAGWAAHHLADLRAELEPSELLRAQVLLRWAGPAGCGLPGGGCGAEAIGRPRLVGRDSEWLLERPGGLVG